jgi:uncharacterized protein
MFDLAALLGGALIGLAASLFLLTHGRVAGISGLLSGVATAGPDGDRSTSFAFLGGLVVVGLGFAVFSPTSFGASPTPIGLVGLAGLLVGVGTQLGSGCTSGHGVCGISALRLRSVIATVTFMFTGGLTVFVVRHLVGQGGQ